MIIDKNFHGFTVLCFMLYYIDKYSIKLYDTGVNTFYEIFILVADKQWHMV